MPKWFFSKDRLLNRTPSCANGVDFPTECRYRREGCRFIMDMGNKSGLRYDMMTTGVIYFHRFYMKQSYKSFPSWVTACTCLFLADKVEEMPKKCRDSIKVARMMLSDRPSFLLIGGESKVGSRFCGSKQDDFTISGPVYTVKVSATKWKFRVIMKSAYFFATFLIFFAATNAQPGFNTNREKRSEQFPIDSNDAGDSSSRDEESRESFAPPAGLHFDDMIPEAARDEESIEGFAPPAGLHFDDMIPEEARDEETREGRMPPGLNFNDMNLQQGGGGGFGK